MLTTKASPSAIRAALKNIGKNYNAATFKAASTMQLGGMKQIVKCSAPPGNVFRYGEQFVVLAAI